LAELLARKRISWLSASGSFRSSSGVTWEYVAEFEFPAMGLLEEMTNGEDLPRLVEDGS